MRSLFALAALITIAVACSDARDALDVNTGPSLGEAAFVCPGQFNRSNLVDEEAAATDANGDGTVCYIDVVSPEDGLLLQRTYVDNNVPNTIAACPRSFELAKGFGSPDDQNGDGSICVAKKPNGSLVTVDNHYEPILAN